MAAAFLLAIFGWGTGFYGPPVFLPAVIDRTGWSVEFVSIAVTVHFLFGAALIACLPTLYRRVGVPTVTSVGVLVLTAGLLGWSIAPTPVLLLVAAVLTGAGWVTMGAAALNAVVSPWFARRRPWALSIAYNGASLGGVIMSPLWAGLIAGRSLLFASVVIAVVMVPTVLLMARFVFSRTPGQLDQHVDGDDAPPEPAAAAATAPVVTTSLWRNRSFATLAAAMALGLFAQIGLLTHLFSVMIPALGQQAAGWVMASVTAASIAGRSVSSRAMTRGVDRRVAAAASYATQLIGALVLLVSAADNVVLLVVGSVLFGLGVGNATSLPPLIAQREFAEAQVQRVVSLAIAVAQGTYAFAPMVFGVLIGANHPTGAGGATAVGAFTLFAVAALIQACAVATVLAGRRPSVTTELGKVR